ncbi:multidrug ABC transporter permease [Sphaerisporangium siamense]|uniref:ATP-binding cassette subfamily C protein n=1 Tax=Sphaerisporangium siamense TaxID=795645 RepID=A0A7W7GAQ5_9ACTN|nr:ABC transporter ATP-binding protein [Sphaerisporangium siamense]MBB4704213.1 ATP-binding cassette subfamily C protein [Sphaerisporangium siamense]GII85105.1 multidrug ABC transporter permease [Sphaerisporangium siamense]
MSDLRAEPSPRAPLRLPVATPARTRAAVRELVRPHRRLATAGFAALVAATAIGLLVQPLLGRVVDLVAGRHPAAALTLPVVLLAAVAVAQGLATMLGLSLVSRLGETVLARLRERFVDRTLRLPLERLERAGSGDLTARVTSDVSRVAEAVRTALPELARSLLAIVLTLAAMAVLDWRFLLAALVAVPVQAHTARWYVRRAVPLYAEQRVAAGDMQQQLLDTIGGAATVRAFRLEEEHAEKAAERSRWALLLTMRGVRLVLRFYSRLHVAEYAGLAAVLVTGFLLVRGGSASIGTATAAALYFHSLFGPVNSALVLMDDAQVAVAGLARLVGVTDLADPSKLTEASDGTAPSGPEDRPAPTANAAPRPEVAPATAADGGAAVAVAGLEHSYEPGRPVLRGVDLALAPGERVALIGASGAGKTTLAKLVAGVHSPTAGTVRVAVPGTEDPAKVVLVTQETHVFSGPLAEDLRLAGPDAGDDELRAALARVGALGWAEALPEGLATEVGEGGHRLTATQVQQLALARLVLAAPPVAVLDEATAEAGSAGARVLEESAERAVEGRTALVVAHRLTQAASADRVVVMDGGQVVESGGHDDLRAAGGPYAALWEAWSDARSGLPSAHDPSTHV